MNDKKTKVVIHTEFEHAKEFDDKLKEELHMAYDTAMHDMMEEEDYIPMEEDPDMKFILEDDDEGV